MNPLDFLPGSQRIWTLRLIKTDSEIRAVQCIRNGDAPRARCRLTPPAFGDLRPCGGGAGNRFTHGASTYGTKSISPVIVASIDFTGPSNETTNNSAQSASASDETRVVARPIVVAITGVSGPGKTTVAAMLAGRLHWRFEEDDNLHSAANIAKMSRGIPLIDNDRRGWLRAIALVIAGWIAEGLSGVVACSALKRIYRQIIIGGNAAVRLVYLRGSRELILRRIAAHHGHFTPVSLLDSQFEILEEPTPEERPIVISIDRRPEQIVTDIIAAITTP